MIFQTLDPGSRGDMSPATATKPASIIHALPPELQADIIKQLHPLDLRTLLYATATSLHPLFNFFSDVTPDKDQDVGLFFGQKGVHWSNSSSPCKGLINVIEVTDVSKVDVDTFFEQFGRATNFLAVAVPTDCLLERNIKIINSFLKVMHGSRTTKVILARAHKSCMKEVFGVKGSDDSQYRTSVTRTDIPFHFDTKAEIFEVESGGGVSARILETVLDISPTDTISCPNVRFLQYVGFLLERWYTVDSGAAEISFSDLHLCAKGRLDHISVHPRIQRFSSRFLKRLLITSTMGHNIPVFVKVELPMLEHVVMSFRRDDAFCINHNVPADDASIRTNYNFLKDITHLSLSNANGPLLTCFSFEMLQTLDVSLSQPLPRGTRLFFPRLDALSVHLNSVFEVPMLIAPHLSTYKFKTSSDDNDLLRNYTNVTGYTVGLGECLLEYKDLISLRLSFRNAGISDDLRKIIDFVLKKKKPKLLEYHLEVRAPGHRVEIAEIIRR